MSMQQTTRQDFTVRSENWGDQVRLAAKELQGLVPPASRCILVDEDKLKAELGVADRALPFLEQAGEYWGKPADDNTAIWELARLRRSGADFMVFAWPAFWWLDHYSGLHRHLRWSFRCVLQNRRLVAFDLRQSERPWAEPRLWLQRGQYLRCELKQLVRNLKCFLSRASSFRELSRLLFASGSEPTLHLCRLAASAHLSGLPTITLQAVLHRLRTSTQSEPQEVRLHPSLRSTGSGSASEIAVLSTLVAAAQPKTILEFGTYDGCSTWHLWANSSQATRIVTVDLPANTKVEGSTDLGLQGVVSRPFLPADQRITLIETDSRSWDPCLPVGVDFCFIDAGHSYDCVRNDTEKALQNMNEGGLMVWHDATWRKDGYGVNRLLREMRHAGLDVRLITIGPFDCVILAVLFV